MNKEFSPEYFKKWMEGQDEQISITRKNYLIGIEVESKLVKNRILTKICVQDGDLYELTEDFIKNGGKIIDVDGKNFIIEVYSGTFSVPRQFVRRSD